MRKPEPKEYVIQPKGWKKRYKCHKNKGDHTFMVEYASICKWPWHKEQKIIEWKKCIACGKQDKNLV